MQANKWQGPPALSAAPSWQLSGRTEGTFIRFSAAQLRLTNFRFYKSAGHAVCKPNCQTSSACHQTQLWRLVLAKACSLTRQEEGRGEGRQLLAVKAAVGVNALGLLGPQHVREKLLKEVWHGCDATGDTLQPLQRGCEWPACRASIDAADAATLGIPSPDCTVMQPTCQEGHQSVKLLTKS